MMRRFILPFMIISFLFAAAVNAAIPRTEPKVLDVVVQENETLWEIAARYTDSTVDVRKNIYNIQKLNHINNPGELQPGQVIKIPIPEK